jgi:aminoglycoside phosphotransferase family enzyme
MPATTDIVCDPDLLAALADASTYGAIEPVEVHETHASWVFLVGDRAFKLIDYVVEMCRFREADTLAGLIASGELGAAHIAAVARGLAAFHRSAVVVAGGGAQEVLRMWRVNVRELSEAGRAPGSSVDLSAGFAEAFVSAHVEEVERRRRGGFVRDGHGDLRCEHVLVLPRVRVVDRIEFGPSLRHTDIACDLAFLTMDLEAQVSAGRPRSS